MRLLTPQEHDLKVKDEESKARRKLERIEEETARGLKTLNELSDEDRAARARISAEHKRFVEETESKRRTLEAEVFELEERKREASKPLDARERELDEREVAIDRKSEDLDKLSSNLSAAQDKARAVEEEYQKKLEDLEEKSSELAGQERKLRDDKAEFKAFMLSKEDAIKQERARLRSFFEEGSLKLKNQK